MLKIMAERDCEVVYMHKCDHMISVIGWLVLHNAEMGGLACLVAILHSSPTIQNINHGEDILLNVNMSSLPCSFTKAS